MVTETAKKATSGHSGGIVVDITPMTTVQFCSGIFVACRTPLSLPIFPVFLFACASIPLH